MPIKENRTDTNREMRIVGTLGAFNKCKEILSVEFYRAEPKWLSTASFTYLMINLADVLRLLKDEGSRLDFKDDLNDGEDIFDAVSQMRNAVCHIGSLQRAVPGNSRVVWVTTKKNEAYINGVTISCDYPDDCAFYFGTRRLYLKRHILRALNDAHAPMAKLAEEIGYTFT